MAGKLDRRVSGRASVVEAEKSAEAPPRYDRSGPIVIGWWCDDLAAQALMVFSHLGSGGDRNVPNRSRNLQNTIVLILH
jgi:hypothetical protein